MTREDCIRIAKEEFLEATDFTTYITRIIDLARETVTDPDMSPEWAQMVEDD